MSSINYSALLDDQAESAEIIRNTFDVLVSGEVTQARISTRLRALENRWNKYQSNHELIWKAKYSSKPEIKTYINESSYLKDKEYQITEEYYLTNVEKITALIEERNGAAANDTLNQTTQQLDAAQGQMLKLPQIKIPEFDGSFTSWINFRDIFRDLVGSNATLKPVQKLYYLKQAVNGNAERLLKNLGLDGSNLQVAWDCLVDFYDNKRTLINSSLSMLFNTPSLTKESAQGLELLYSEVTQSLTALEALERPVKHWDDLLVFIITKKLDRESIKEWDRTLGSSTQPPTLVQLKSFIISRIRSLQAYQQDFTTFNSATTSTPKQSSTRKNHLVNVKKPQCSLCKEEHYLSKCSQYLSLTIEQRIEKIKLLNVCFNCLGPHPVSQCKSTMNCYTCGKRHHSTIHRFEKSNSPVDNTPPSPHAHNVIQSYDHEASIGFLATANILLENEFGELIECRGLVDPGAQATLISEKLSQRLHLRRKHSQQYLGFAGGSKCVSPRGIVHLKIHSRWGNLSATANAFILVHLTNYTPNIAANGQWPHLQGLHLADPQYHSSKPIDILLGVDVYSQIIEEGVRKGPTFHSPIAQKTSLGWIISGHFGTDSNNNGSASIFHISVDTELSEIVKQFWLQQEVFLDSGSNLTTEEEKCEEHYQRTHTREKNGRYVVRLPQKESPEKLGDSRATALRMLNSMLRRFQSNPDLHRRYSEFLQEYEDLGHMVRVKPNQQNTPVYYLPHHAVLRETSLTTKLRVVFNGSAKTTTGVSLNDILHEGPKTQSDIINVINNWRKHKYVYSADITKMFRQVVVHQSDRDLQRILWKGESEDIIEYQLCTVTYGTRPAPYLAIRTLQQLVTDDGDKFPEAKDIIRENTYVDDVYGGSSTIEQCKRQIEQVNKLCESGGFPLQKWTANHPELLKEIVNTREEKITNHLIDSSELHRTLGLNWNSEADFFFYLPKIESNEKTLTKRIILSKVAQLYDPLGWISPFIVQGKLLIQDLWKLSINWDEAVPEIFQTRWNKIHQELIDLIPMRINRHLGISDSTTKFELHGFSDASQIAYGSVLYLRTIDTNGDVRVALISSKSKLAPINLESKESKRKKNIRITIPRLELMAASLLTKHALATAQAMKLNDIKMHLWSDSSISLYWIKSDASRYQQFVKNRIQSIQQTLPQATWHHVPGHQNPADLVSRGVSAKRLVNDSRWLNGPDWLGKPADEWPSTFPELHKTLDLEQKNSFVGNVTVTPSITWSLLNKFSSLNLLIRVTAWCRRLFLIKLQKLKTSEPKVLYQRLVLSPKEIEDSRKFWIRITQADHFPSEIQQLAKEKQLPNQSKLHRLTPFLDQEGLMRLGGRLRNADLSEAAKHPIIIPRDSTLTQLILHQTHQETLHGQCQLMLSVLRQNYWIVGGRQPVKAFIFKCIRCSRFRGKLACQLMGQLPLRRLTPAKPFAHSGVDYAGPFSILSWRKRGAKTYKGYLVVFVCLTTSAVHLELATDYTTTGFLAAYKRFSSRRGKISTISSDCGTNLVGADNELKRLFSQASKENEVIANALSRDNTEWKFNPPSSPHFGGKWEAAVKSTKFHIQRVLGDQLLTYEEFSTFLAQIEAILNSRPLTQITEDPTDPEALTPGHFLNAAPLIAVPEPSVLELPVNRLSIYQHIQQMTEKFWRRWSSEYIHQLQEINKWQRREPNLEVGRLVLITDERLPPTKWALGRITEIHLGKDGLSRVATVKTQHSTFTKPIVRLCPLPVEMSPKDELST